MVNVTDVTTRNVHVDATWSALVAWNDRTAPEPRILLRGDTLTRVSHDEEHSKLAPFTKASLGELLAEAVIFFKVTMTGNVQYVAPPDYIISALLDRTPDKLPDALRVSRVVEVPVFGRPDAEGHATVLGTPGYDPGSRAYFAPPPHFNLPPFNRDLADEHSAVRREEVDEALSLLVDHLPVDFPFTDEASRAHAVCMAVEPFVREAIGASPTPLYGVIAHTPGTGKGYLTQGCLGIACGPSLPTMTFTGGKGFEAAENRKGLTAKLIEAPPVIFYDNVTEPLDSGVLAAALTSTQWNDRILGVSKMADVPIRNVWVFTANNPSISRELTRRIVPIFLDPGDIDPLSRTAWTHPLPKWANDNRAELVMACITLAANYFAGNWTTIEAADGTAEEVRTRPATMDVLATFPMWSHVMGGILKAAGLPGFLGNLDKLHAEASVTTNEEADFLSEWFTRQGGSQGNAFTLTELCGGFFAARPDLGYPAAVELPLGLRGHGDKFEAKFGAWLRDHHSQVIGGYRVKKVGQRPTRWVVEKIGA